jgi:UDP:flavonoid glycosyltransferase YjiC (YdhE family)
MHFGVPMICLPISADHPIIAHMVAKLGLGIKLDINCFHKGDIVQSISKIFADNKYNDTCAQFSEFSGTYQSQNLFSSEILNYLNET